MSGVSFANSTNQSLDLFNNTDACRMKPQHKPDRNTNEKKLVQPDAALSDIQCTPRTEIEEEIDSKCKIKAPDELNSVYKGDKGVKCTMKISSTLECD